MAAVRRMSQQRMQATSFALEGRPMSSESFDTTRRRFLNAPLPAEPKPDDEFYRPPKAYSPPGDKKKKKKKKKAATKDSFDPNKDDREEQRLQELKEKHMRVLDDLGKLKAHYYMEYMDALTDKVEDQRKDIQRKSEAHQRRLLRKEKKEREAAQRAKIEMHRPEVSTDNAFLRGLPKTHFHKIVILQDALAREGRLRRDEDVRAFWEELRRPEVYHRMFGDAAEDGGATEENRHGSETRTTKPTQRGGGGEVVYGSDMDSQASASESNSMSLGSLRHQLDPHAAGSLAQIQEVREPSRPNSMGGPYVQSWINEPKLKKKNSQTLITRKPVHPKVLEMEERCPRVEFPKLAAFTLDLEPPKEDPEVEEMREEFRSRARLRNSEVRRLRKMYENSITNSAATKRIIDMKEELTQVMNGPALGDVLHVQDSSDCLSLLRRRGEEEEEEEEERARARARLALLPPPEMATANQPRLGSNPGTGRTPSFAIERISEEGDIEEENDIDDDDDEELREQERGDALLTYISRSSSRRSSLTSTESEIRRNTPVMPETRRAQPLTMSAIMDKTEIKVVNCPSTLWVNYGKFLPSVN